MSYSERYEWMVVQSNAVPTYPTGNGGTTTNAALGMAKAGKRVKLRACIHLNSATAEILTITDGAGVAYSSGGPTMAFVNTGSMGQNLDIELTNGLGAMGSAGAAKWLVIFRVID